jgi:hypothetical protein
MSRPKETEFFNWRYRRGWDWFATHFDHCDGEAAVGEASTRTMPAPEAPERIAERMPEAKLIFVLRDPAERAHSTFWYYMEQGILCPDADFSAFIRNEGHPLRQEMIHYGYYERHLDRFLQVFARSQLLLLRHRDLRTDMSAELERVCQFIGIDPADFENEDPSTRSNATQYPRSQFLYGLGRRAWKPIDQLVSSWAPGVMDAIRRAGKNWMLAGSRPPLSASDRAYLWSLYSPTVSALEDRFTLDLAHWWPRETAAASRR